MMRVGFSPEAIVQIQYPEQGINNQTYIVQQANGPDLVIKMRPVSSKSKTRFRKAGKNNPYWPRYTQELFGPYPNGDISTLPEITRTLEVHGGLRVPHVYLDDTSLDLVPAPSLVSERLSGIAFDWNARPFTNVAARQLGEHLARVQEWLQETMARYPGGVVLAIAHYGTIGLLGMLCESLRPEVYLARRPDHLTPGYGSLLSYRRHEGGWERDFLYRNPLADAIGGD
jgi:hypothetical protein